MGIFLIALSIRERVYEFPCTKAPQNISLLPGKYLFEAWGAQGNNFTDASSGEGGYSSGILSFRKKQTFYVYVGEKGHVIPSGSSEEINGSFGSSGGLRGCFNGGTGGGGTDISLVFSEIYYDPTFLTFERTSESYLGRILVAGGGGGAYNILPGFVGGGINGGGNPNGNSQNLSVGNVEFMPGAGTQTSGGNAAVNAYDKDLETTLKRSRAGQFGIGGTYYSTHACSSGPGGGWFGGGFGVNAPGAGGSGYVLTENSWKPPNYIPNQDFYFSNPILISGSEEMPDKSGFGTSVGNKGDGFARITLLEKFSNSFSHKKPKKIELFFSLFALHLLRI